MLHTHTYPVSHTHMHTQMNAQMADETLQVIFGTILGAFCSKYLGQGLAGVCDKVRGRKIKTLRRMGAHSTHNLQLQRLALTILAFIPLHQRVVRTYLLLTMHCCYTAHKTHA